MSHHINYSQRETYLYELRDKCYVLLTRVRHSGHDAQTTARLKCISDLLLSSSCRLLIFFLARCTANTTSSTLLLDAINTAVLLKHT